MSNRHLRHTSWCALGVVTAVLLSGCSSNPGDSEATAAASQAVVGVPTTPIYVTLTLPGGVNSSSVLLSAYNQLTINGGGTVGDASRLTTIAGLGSGTQLMIQAGSRVFGNVLSGSPITVSSNAIVYGPARSGGNIDVQSGAQVIGGVTRNSAPGTAGMNWVVNWPTDAGTAVNREPPNGTLSAGTPGEAILPGHYTSFNIKSRNRITFSTGTYFIDDFNLEPEAEVMIDNRNGPVVVYTKNSFRYQGKFLPLRDTSGTPIAREGNLYVGHLGTNAADITGPFVGVLIAPNADIYLNSPNSGQHKGGFFGKNITLSANGNSALLPLDYDLNVFTDGEVQYGDADGDGTTDDKDLCPTNPKKIEPGVCGCNTPDTDTNGDGIPNCVGGETEYCSGKPAGSECYSTICPSSTAKKTCSAAGVCGDPVAECAPGGDGTASGCTYKVFKSSVYWICNKSVTWQEASAKCQEVPGRNLVHVDGRIENAWLDMVTSSNMWVGGSKSGANGSWSWTQGTDDGAFPFWTDGPTGTRIDGRYNHWQSGQPSDGTCAAMQPDGTWAAKDCGTPAGFICEQPLHIGRPPEELDICKFYPGAVCPGTPTPTPSTCVPASSANLMDGTKEAFANATNDCNSNCTDSSKVGTPACTDHCQGVLPIPDSLDTCPKPIGVARPVCDIKQSGYGAVCQPGVTTCANGQTCGRVYECAQLDSSKSTKHCSKNSDCTTNVCHPTHKVCMDPSIKLPDTDQGTNRSADDFKCFTSYHCGTPVEGSCDTNYFSSVSALPCNEVEICNPNKLTSDHIDPMDPVNGSNLTETPFNPDTVFAKPDAPVATPFASAGLESCTKANPCSFGTTHPWCKAQVDPADNKTKPQGVTDEGSADDKQGHSGTGGPLKFDFDPNLSLDYKITPGLFGDSQDFFVEAKAAAKASVTLTNFLGVSDTIDVLDALGDIRVDRCGLVVDARTKLLGIDFLPTILGDAYDDLHKFDTSADTRKQCQEGIAQFQSEVSRVAKSLRDAQELIRQYKAVVDNGDTMAADFCSSVINGFVPWDFPKINCSTAKPEAVVNAFIDYYKQQAINLAGKGIDSLMIPSFDQGLFSGSVGLGGTGGRETQNLINLPFAIGPIPMNLTVDAYLDYGLSGELAFGLTPDGFLQTLKDREPADLAYARAHATPHAGAGIEMFVGAGFDCGFASAKIGISGDVCVGDISVPLTAGAYLNVRSEKEERPLSTDLQAANGSATYDVYFPPVGPSRFRFGAGYEYDASVDIINILKGEIDAKLKLSFLFFSKSWKIKIAEFGGLPKQHYTLFSGKGGIEGAIDLSGVDLGAVSMPLPFLKLPHVTAPSTTGIDPTHVPAKVSFDPSRAEKLFYDNQCAIRPPSECPRIFAEPPVNSNWLDAEKSNSLAAYGSTGFTTGNYVYLMSDHTDGGVYNGDIAIGTPTGVGAFGTGNHLQEVFGGTKVTYPANTVAPYLSYWPAQATGTSPGTIVITVPVPAISLNTAFPAALTRPNVVDIGQGQTLHYLPSDYAGTVTIHNGGTLSLDGSGQYFFNGLIVEPGAVVLINHGNGAVEVSVKSTLTWQGRLLNGTGARSNTHVVGYYGTSDVTLNSPYGFNGTLVAPKAKVTLNAAYYHGAFYAKTLNIATGASISYLPCHPWTPPRPPVDVF